MESLYKKATDLLIELIATPSFSREEAQVASILENFFRDHGIEASRVKNNIWAKNKHFDFDKPTVLLNSHHDTVKPNSGYTRDPFKPEILDGKLYGDRKSVV